MRKALQKLLLRRATATSRPELSASTFRPVPLHLTKASFQCKWNAWRNPRWRGARWAATSLDQPWLLVICPPSLSFEFPNSDGTLTNYFSVDCDHNESKMRVARHPLYLLSLLLLRLHFNLNIVADYHWRKYKTRNCSVTFGELIKGAKLFFRPHRLV